MCYATYPFFYRYLSANKYIISVQNPIQLSSYSLPQPDVVVAHYREGLLEKHIQPQDIALLIEVSDSSYDYDRHTKLKEYAAANVAEYWIVNLSQQQIEVYTRPEGNGYMQINIYQRAFDTSLAVVRLSPEDILPKKA
jgi:Uma2 family endonuclease